jgi:ABC-type transport system substrate-binding protein
MKSFLAFALGLGLCASACGSPGDRSAAEAGAAREHDEPTTLTLLVLGDELDLRPSVNQPPMHLLFLPLFSRDSNGEIEGRLVRSWESSEDGKTWTYHLRTDVLWHDGVPFSARDIEYSIDLKRQRLYETPKARQVEIVDDSTVQITYGASNRPPLDSWFVYLPSHLLSEMTADELWESK